MIENYICVYNKNDTKFPFILSSVNTYFSRDSQMNFFFKIFINNISIKNIISEREIYKSPSGGIHEVVLYSPDLHPNIRIIAAMKRINKQWITGILEPYIMIHISSLYINKSIGTFFDRYGNCQILQPMSSSDAAEIVRKKKIILSEKKLKKWSWQILKGIEHLHSKGILHGDIKARNVLIFEDDVRITDFGISIIFLKETKKIPGFLYTPTHRPPENFKNQEISLSADIWALGCTFYELAYNKLLFNAQKDNESYLNEILNINLSENKRPKFLELIKKMLKLDPAERIDVWGLLSDDYFSEFRLEEIKHNIPNFDFLQTTLEWKDIMTLSKLDLDLEEDIDVLKYTSYLLNRTKGTNISIESFLRISYRILYNYVPEKLRNESYSSFQEFLHIQNLFNYDFYPVIT